VAAHLVAGPTGPPSQAVQCQYRLTYDVEFEEVSGRDVGEGDLHAVGGHERLVEASHDVDLCPLGQLLFAPDHRVVEERVGGATERAFEARRSAFVDDVELRIGEQRHVVGLRVDADRRLRCCKMRQA